MSTAMSYDAEGWFGGSVRTNNQADVSGSGRSDSYSTSDSVADIPIFIPVPFKELSSVEYWRRDDLIWQMSDALKAQFPRHCFIQIPERKTQPMLVPFVKEFRLYPQDVEKYKLKLYSRVEALPAAEVDALLSAEREQLKARAMEYLTSSRESAPAETVDQYNKDFVE